MEAVDMSFNANPDHGQFFRAASTILANHVIATWSWLLPKDAFVLGMSLFGDAFLIDPQGTVYMLDLVAGNVKPIAVCKEEFEWEVGQEKGRNEWLMVPLASHLAASGVVPSDQECYAFRTPPILGGAIAPANVILWDVFKYHTGLSKIVRQVGDLPPGTQVVAR